MISNYLKIALRNLLKYKTFSFVHIIGFSISITCIIVILRYVQFEISYDKFNLQAENIYRVTGSDWVTTPAPLAPALKEYFPEISATVRIKNSDKILLNCNKKSFYEENVIFADPNIFDIFSYPFIAGNSRNALSQPFSIVISRKMAHKYFGNNNPIGKKITFENQFDFQVTGILENIPKNSHLQFDFVCPLECVKTIYYSPGFLENRINTVVSTYCMIKRKDLVSLIGSKLDNFARHYIGEDLYKWYFGPSGRSYQLQPVTSIHLYSNLKGEFIPGGSINTVYIFSSIALLILFIACINYMNLATASYMNRIKEVGIRKVAGAGKGQIVLQFLCESVLLTVISFVLAVAFSELAVSLLNNLWENTIALSKTDISYLFWLFIIALATGLLSGIYPAFFISKYHPVSILSKAVLFTKTGFSLKSILVTFQFTICAVLIIATLVISKQMLFIRNRNLGFNKEQIAVVPIRDNAVRQKYKALKQELLNESGVTGVTASSALPGGVKCVRSFHWEGQAEDEDNTMNFIVADFDFLKIYGIKLIEGRDFSETFASDKDAGFILNKKAVEKLGWKSPIGKEMDAFKGRTGLVIGVMQDFHFKSLHDKIEPLVIYISPEEYSFISVKIRTENIQSVLNKIEQKCKLFSGNKPFEFFFLDDYLNKLYQKEQNTEKVYTCFSAAAIFIACLGLFGLAAFISEKRTKEIGIRKILGSTSGAIVLMLSYDYVKKVILANLIAWPMSYYIMNKWLQNFAYHIQISWWIFLLTGVFTTIIALFTVSYHAVRAAITNPVDSLKYE